MLFNLPIKILGSVDLVEKTADIASKMVSFTISESFIHILSIQLNNETFMSFLLKAIIITIVTVLSLFIGGWIASRIIKMDKVNNLIDW